MITRNRSAESRGLGTGVRHNRSGRRCPVIGGNYADAIIPGVRDIQVAIGADRDSGLCVETPRNCGTSIAFNGTEGTSGDRSDDAPRVDPPNPVWKKLGHIEIAGGIQGDATGRDWRCGRQNSFTSEPLPAVSRGGFNDAR